MKCMERDGLTEFSFQLDVKDWGGLEKELGGAAFCGQLLE